jgi:D-glycero-D-manno-heptose 1,7-bisphosphate phosphatase
MYEEAFVLRTHAVMTARLEAGGARVDGYYYCPHHPEATIDRYRRQCDCRKPGPGLLRAAARDLDIDLAASFAVGDKWTDVQAGQSVGARGILVRTGYGASNEAAPIAGLAPALVTDNLMSAVSWMIRERDRGPR